MPEYRQVDSLVKCRTPVAGQQGSDIPKWKFDTVFAAITIILRNAGSQGVPLCEMQDRISLKLTTDQKARLGSIMWYFMAVSQEMEVRGDIMRAVINHQDHLILSIFDPRQNKNSASSGTREKAIFAPR